MGRESVRPIHIGSHVEAPPASSEPPRVLYALDMCVALSFLVVQRCMRGMGCDVYIECAYGARV